MVFRRACLDLAIALAGLGGRPFHNPAIAAAVPLILDLRADCGAAGDGRADDAAALKSCLTRLASGSAGTAKGLKFPAGIYRISGAAGPMPTMPRAISISGDGPAASVIKLDLDFSGPLFSFAEAWGANHYGPKSLDIAHDASGPVVAGLKIVGSLAAKERQAGIEFFDRNDFVLLRDIEIDYVNGPCLSIGHLRRMPQAYMREASFYNVKCWNSGSRSEPAVEIVSTTAENSDATNELDFYKLAIFAARNVGLAIRNPNPFSATRKLRFFGLRVEQSGGDGVEIAPAGDKGQVAEIDMYDLSVLTSAGAGLRIGGPDAKQPYAIGVHGGLFGPGNKIGIAIDNGRLISIELSGLDAPVVLGAGAGSDIEIRGNGGEHDWRYEGTKAAGSVAVPLNLRSEFGLYGLPSAGQRVGAAALQGQSVEGKPARLTMDGKPAGAYNCFNPAYAQAFNLGIRVIAVDRNNPTRWYAWSAPLAVFSAWTGPGAAKLWTSAPLAQHSPGAAGASVEAGADARDGCLSLVFNPPGADKGVWDVSALIEFARAP